MARTRKPIEEVELDDDNTDLDQEALELLYDKFMEEVSEILGEAYNTIGAKARQLVDDAAQLG